MKTNSFIDTLLTRKIKKMKKLSAIIEALAVWALIFLAIWIFRLTPA